jgi:hypothetical protein
VRRTSRQCRLITLGPSGSRNPDALSIVSLDFSIGPARQEEEEFGFSSAVGTVVKISQHIGLTELFTERLTRRAVQTLEQQGYRVTFERAA